MKFILLLLVFMHAAQAATLYCSPSGGGSGADFNNLATLPNTTSFTRGNTYIIIEGSYGAKTFSTATSGSTLITIKKASTADSAVAGYATTLFDAQATFSSLTMGSAYWTIDGMTGGGPGAWESGHGILVNGAISDDSFGVSDDNEDNCTFSQIEVDIGSVAAEDVNAVSITYINNWTFERCFIHDIGGDVFKIAYGCDNLIVEYCKIKTGYQSGTVHSDVFEAQAATFNDWTMRYNFFENLNGTYMFGAHDTATVDGYIIHGNIIKRANGFYFGNGLVATLSAGGTLTVLVFNQNTIFGDFDASVGISNPGSGSISGSAQNNVWVEDFDSGYSFGYSSLTQSYNSHYNMDTVSGTGNETPSGDPFTDSAAGDFSTLADTTAGTSLSSPYDVDMFGNSYSAGGGWTRGAVAYGEGGGGPSLNTARSTRLKGLRLR